MNDVGLLPGMAICCVLALVGCGLLAITRHHNSDLKLQWRIFLVALAIRFAFSVVIYQGGLVKVLGDEDGAGWYFGSIIQGNWVRDGITIVDLPRELLSAMATNRHTGYYYLLALFFWITDCPYRLPAAALNAFFGALTVILVYRIARTLFSNWVAMRVAILTMVFPSLVTWSAMTVKEPVVIFLETLGLYCCIQLARKGVSWRYLGFGIATMIALLPFRFYAAYMVAAVAFVSLVVIGLGRFRSGFAALVMLLVVLPLGMRAGGDVLKEQQIETFNLQRIQTFRRDISTNKASEGSASGVMVGDVRTTTGLATALTVGAAHLMLAPFPWELGGASLRMLFTLPELLFWWYLFAVGVVPGLLYSMRKRFWDVLPILLLTAGFGLLYSLMFGNVGLVFRQRAQILPWLLIFAAVGLEQTALRRAAARRARPQPVEPWVRPGRRVPQEAAL